MSKVMTFLTVALIEGWAWMILLGMFAGYLAVPGLAIGYWASLVVGLVTRLAWPSQLRLSEW